MSSSNPVERQKEKIFEEYAKLLGTDKETLKKKTANNPYQPKEIVLDFYDVKANI